MKRITFITLTITGLLFGVSACGGGSDNKPQTANTSAPAGLSKAEMTNGIGPVKELTVGPIDEAVAAKGEALFTVKCSACHKMDKRYVGPALGDVTARRAPAYIMNMILNPEGMIQNHPEAKALLAQFMTPMANQHLTQEEARAVLEYLRKVGA